MTCVLYLQRKNTIRENSFMEVDEMGGSGKMKRFLIDDVRGQIERVSINQSIEF